jgi:hypothetical protein
MNVREFLQGRKIPCRASLASLTCQPSIASLALESPQQPSKQKPCQKTLDPEADDERYFVARICSWSESDSPIVEEQVRYLLGEVSCTGIVIDQQIHYGNGLPISPQDKQECLEH